MPVGSTLLPSPSVLLFFSSLKKWVGEWKGGRWPKAGRIFGMPRMLADPASRCEPSFPASVGFDQASAWLLGVPPSPQPEA